MAPSAPVHLGIGLLFLLAVVIGAFRPALWPGLLALAALPALTVSVFMLANEFKSSRRAN